MTKQPDQGRSSLPRHDSALSDSFSGEPIPPAAPIVPKLRTVAPPTRKPNPSNQNREPAAKRSTKSKLAKDESPKLIRRKPQPTNSPEPKKRRSNSREYQSNNPFPYVGQPIDLESIRNGIQEHGNFERDNSSLGSKIERNRNPLSSFFVSLTVHVAVLLVLALAAFKLDVPNRSLGIIAEIDSTPTLDEPANEVESIVKIEVISPKQSPLDSTSNEKSLDTEVNVAESVSISPNLVAEDSEPTPSTSDLTPSPSGLIPTGGGLTGRDAASRAALAGKRGGTRESEMAVELGLKWIVAHQRKDGSWRFVHDDGRCRGQCENQGLEEATTAATGMALLALLGSGNTHKTGKYQKEVQKGLDYLTSKMRISPHGGNLTSGKERMYAHAIATLALSEAFIMTTDTDLMGPIDQARKYIETVQHKAGGWRYQPGQKGDLSVTGWQIMALKSCQMSGSDVSELTLQTANDFVDSMAGPSRGYGYVSPGESPAMTSIGVLSKMYLGAKFNEGTLPDSTRMLNELGPSPTDMYYNYHATQVLHHRHDPGWEKWNQVLREHLISSQDRSQTHRVGSWYFADHHARLGGRLYTTAIAVMTLEVYYRYLPLYDEKSVKSLGP